MPDGLKMFRSAATVNPNKYWGRDPAPRCSDCGARHPSPKHKHKGAGKSKRK